MSQLGADDWVLSLFPDGYKGFFLDVGCGDAEYISNTYQLEKKGWRGVCIDAFPRYFGKRPNSIVVNAVVYSEKDKDVDFVIPSDHDLSAIVNCLGSHKSIVLNTVENIVKYKTSLLQDILDNCSTPSYIDYMNLDIEGAEYEVLKVFPFDKYTFGCISIEHNFEEPKKTLMHDLLTNNGYKLYKEVKWDLWYVSTSRKLCLNSEKIQDLSHSQ